MTAGLEPPAAALAQEFLYRSVVTLAPVQAIGPVPDGERRIIPITGGRFEGPRLKGEVLPGGADWQVVRRDGSAHLDARYTLRTDDGALIYVRNVGVRHGPPDVLARLANGEAVDPRLYYFRTTPRFECGDARYAWLNHLVAVATAIRRSDSVVIDVYAIR